MNFTVREVVFDRKEQKRRSSALLRALGVFPAATGVALFLPWDVAGRSSFALLATTERAGLFPGWFPAKPVLMWWVLLPVVLFGAAMLEMAKVGSKRVTLNTRLLRAVVLLAAHLSVFVVAFAVSQAPIAGTGAMVAVVVSAAGVVGGCARLWMTRRA